MKYNGRVLRHELKYYIDEETAVLLRTLLKNIMVADQNVKHPEGYLVSSLYFDDIYNSALQEKIWGVGNRKKFRIRSYNLDDSLIRLECKEKYNQYIAKRSSLLTREAYDQILKGNYEVLADKKDDLSQEFYIKTKIKGLHPVVVVEYIREAYIARAGNVRITFDKEISVSITSFDFFSKKYLTHRALEEGQIVLEVKYDEVLPEYIKQAINIINTQQCAISKYVMCREKMREVKHI